MKCKWKAPPNRMRRGWMVVIGRHQAPIYTYLMVEYIFIFSHLIKPGKIFIDFSWLYDFAGRFLYTFQTLQYILKSDKDDRNRIINVPIRIPPNADDQRERDNSSGRPHERLAFSVIGPFRGNNCKKIICF